MNPRLAPYATSVFSATTELAVRTGSVNLGQGAPDYDGPQEVLKAARQAISSGHNQYAPSRGVPVLRRAIADHQRHHYGIDLNPDTQVTVTAGATGAMAAAVLSLVSPGDEVIMLDPAYDSYLADVALAGGVAVPLPLRGPSLEVDGAELESLVTPRTKLILLNSPHNPTGRVLSLTELQAVAAVAVEHDLVVVTDEVYEHLTFDDAVHVPLSTLPGMAGRTVTISSAAKTFSVTGWKIGWATGPAELVDAVAWASHHLTFANGAPFQHAVATALGLPDEVIADSRAHLQANRDLLVPALEGTGMRVLPSQGTYFVTADVSPITDLSGPEFCTVLASRYGVAPIAEQVFCIGEDTRRVFRPLIRFGLCLRRESIQLACERLAAMPH